MQAPFPLFGALNVPYRIIELLHTNRHRELLSVGPEVQILSGTPESTAASLFSGLAAFLFFPSPGNFTSVTGRFLYAASFFVMALDSVRVHCLQFGGGLSHAGCGTI